MVRWWWFGAAVEKPEILHELQQMKTDGIGGAELAFVYPEVLNDPAKNLKNLSFLSPGMLDAVHYAQAEARKLGLRIDVTLCSGWPYGGPATTLAEAAGRLRFVEVPVPANATSVTPPTLAEGETFISASIANGEPKRWDATTAQSIATNPGAPGPDSRTWANLPLTANPQPRTALFFIASHTRQQVKRAAVGAEGYVLDPFSHQAVATHLQKVGEPLVKAFGATPPYAIFSDSLEAYGADWTPNLPTEFQKRRGYDLLPHLPELVAGGTPAAEKVRHDWGQTLTELVNENYLTQINNWAIAHHTKFRSQTYGEPAVTFSSQRLVALPEGEGPQWRAFSTLRWATSANHVFNNNVTSGETFTWLHSPVFRATPLDMKAEADIDFIMGENQLIFHGWPYSPPDRKVSEPGWSLYAAAVFNDHNPWHPVMPDVARYIQRISYLLRQGQPANQVAILLPTDDAWASFSPGKVTVTGAMQKLITPALMSAILSAGYNVDFIDADAINVGLGKYQILVIPPTDRIPVETLSNIVAWTKMVNNFEHGRVIAVGHLPTMDAEGNPSPVIAGLSKAIMLVPNTAELEKALDNIGHPDFKLASSDHHTKEVVGFIHRRLPDADIYFVANTSNQAVQATATFSTPYSFGEQWDPDTTTSVPATVTSQAIHLAPYESRAFIFSNGFAPGNLSSRPESSQSHREDGVERSAVPSNPPTQLADLSTDWQVTFTSTKETETEPTLTDWTADPATRNYSGEAVYARDFTLAATPNPVVLEIEGGKPLPGAPNSPPEHPALGPNGLPDPRITRPGPGMHAFYDPPIHEAAIVFVNGQRAGSLWHPPYRLNVSKLLKPGENHIEIHVYNTALNAWSALPPHDYKPLIEKYGDRFQMQDLDKVQPIPSGILGTIHLVTQEVQ
jgi:alpha-L-rhamnosidase